MYSRNAADAGAYCHRVVLSWALFPAMVATGTDWILRQPVLDGGNDLEEMKSGELDFLKATALGRSDAPVFLCSDMPMDDMAKDRDFTKKYMFGLAVLLKKGLHLNVVHNLDRPFHELMLGLEGWIPLYMTGQITPCYLKGVQNNVYCHFLNVSGSAALSGECIAGAHERGRYELTKGGAALRYYQERADAIRKKALPLMDIYREKQATALHAFQLADAQKPGPRRRVLSAPPLGTLPPQNSSAFWLTRQRSVPVWSRFSHTAPLRTPFLICHRKSLLSTRRPFRFLRCSSQRISAIPMRTTVNIWNRQTSMPVPTTAIPFTPAIRSFIISRSPSTKAAGQ